MMNQMNPIKCRWKNCNETYPSKLEFNHFIPKCWDKQLAEQNHKRYLCKKHHQIYHNLLSCWVYEFIPEDKKNDLIKFIENKLKRIIDL